MKPNNVAREIHKTPSKPFALWNVHAMNRSNATRNGCPCNFFYEKLVVVEKLLVAAAVAHISLAAAVVV
jgi:hypothetical protein